MSAIPLKPFISCVREILVIEGPGQIVITQRHPVGYDRISCRDGQFKQPWIQDAHAVARVDPFLLLIVVVLHDIPFVCYKDDIVGHGILDDPLGLGVEY